MFTYHGNEVSVRCFSSFEKAERWIEWQIDEKVAEYGIDRDKWVDGWFVKLGFEGHTLQYDAKEMKGE